ncbi:hypothetical protein HDV01_007119 [Terramyces sp. JEL0728]|nr:hypothetical protein HDV01_007119 [Terramyces sp. JEL0728]
MGLAGPRQKQRITVDPRNKNWTEDKGAIGFKMLEKMGWSEGKGLGSDESGRQTNIKVSLKTNSWGVGADAKTADNWLENTFALDDMFKNIAETDSIFIMPEPEEKQAPVISSRHLKRAKFVKNKIVSNFDSSSINNIFGKKRDGERAVKAKEKEAQDQPLHIVDGLTTVSTGTDIKDYFAQKMASKGINFASLLSGNVDPKESTPGQDIPPLEQDSPQSEDDSKTLDSPKKEKKSKKEKKEKSKKKDKLTKVKGDKVSKKKKERK